MIELPTGYYLANFQTLLSFVRDQYGDVLNEREHLFYQSFADLPQNAARLYVRLISRKGPHFRVDKLQYAEIEQLPQALALLVEAGLVERNGPLPMSELLPLLSRAELEVFLAPVGDRAELKRCRKGELLSRGEALLDETHREVFYQQYGVVTPRFALELLIYRLLFFGNLHQDLTEFVLLDLGLLRYETYQIRPEDRLFQNRAVLDQTLAWLRIRELAWHAEQARDGEALALLCDDLPDTLGEAALSRRRDRLLNSTGRFKERAGDLEGALFYYRQAELPPSRERRARILEKQQEYAQALQLCGEIEAKPHDEDELEFAQKFCPKLRKKLGESVPKPQRVGHPVVPLLLPKVAGRRVEEAVLHHYAERDIEGFYAENHLWNDLFGLLFWDIIFMPVRGAFFNRYQRGPKGLFSSRFRREREAAVADRIETIAKGKETAALARRTLQEKQGVANHFVNWKYVDPELIKRVLTTLPPPHLAAILGRMTLNPRAYRGGLPDLFTFRGSEGYKLVEVKGPGDQIQTNQGRWMRFFAEHQIPYCVARVTYRED